MAALLVVPTAAAHNLARGMRSYLVLGIVAAIAAGVGGLFLSSRLHVSSGGAGVLGMRAIFFLTLSGRRAAAAS